MNRKQRRASKTTWPLPAAREDKRPLYYDINASDRVYCYHCRKQGLYSLYGARQAVMNDPANGPDESGDIHTICIHHLPDNAVIYDPHSNQCRDKTGQNVWMEDTPDPNAAFKA